MEETLAIFIASTLRLAMPLMLAASGELVSERAGVLNLSLEGMMLTAAFFGALGSWATGSPFLGVGCAVLAAVALSAVQAWLSINLRANQLVVGIGFNILALGATTLLYRIIFGGLSREEIPGLPKLSVPGLSDLPFAGTAFFQQSVIVYFGFGLILLIWWMLNQTSFGLAVRAVGDEPRSADKAGIPVARTRWLAVLITGAMAGMPSPASTTAARPMARRPIWLVLSPPPTTIRSVPRQSSRRRNRRATVANSAANSSTTVWTRPAAIGSSPARTLSSFDFDRSSVAVSPNGSVPLLRRRSRQSSRIARKARPLARSPTKPFSSRSSSL